MMPNNITSLKWISLTLQNIHLQNKNYGLNLQCGCMSNLIYNYSYYKVRRENIFLPPILNFKEIHIKYDFRGI